MLEVLVHHQVQVERTHKQKWIICSATKVDRCLHFQSQELEHRILEKMFHFENVSNRSLCLACLFGKGWQRSAMARTKLNLATLSHWREQTKTFSSMVNKSFQVSSWHFIIKFDVPEGKVPKVQSLLLSFCPSRFQNATYWQLVHWQRYVTNAWLVLVA